MRYCYSLLFTLFVLANTAKATHFYGADFFYEAISLNAYRISLVVYGDCKGASFPSLQGATPQVTVRDSTVVKATLTLTQQGPGVEVTPVCPAEVNNTVCTNPNNPLPGVKRYIYTTTYIVPYTSKKWIFRFTGTMGSGASAGRSYLISNIVSGSIVTLEAALNNVPGPNSSPKFTTIPTPFYCVNVPQQYNQGAVDINNDSLVYALAPGLNGAGTVSYNAGYFANAPLSVTAGSFSFSSSTGQLAFTPDAIQQSLVVNQVTEYRNGVMVGTASREMTFVVLTNCNNTPASSSIDTAASSTSGGVPASTTTFNVCEGTDSMHFNIVPLNPGNDTIFATVNGLPVGATATITQNNTTYPVITFDWKPTVLFPGTYNFFVTYKDNGCPLSSQQTQAYSIQVFRPNEMTTAIVAPTQCVHKAFVKYTFTNGLLPRIITVKQFGKTAASFIDTSGTVFDSLGVGNYTVTIISPNLPCPTVYPLSIVDSGLYPHQPLLVSPIYYCMGDQSLQLLAKPDSGAFIKWYNTAGTVLPATPTPRTDTTGIFIWYVNQRYKVCESLKDSIRVYVTKRPMASIAGPSELCINDTASFYFNGSIGEGPILAYVWDWGDVVYTLGHDEGPWQVHWPTLGLKTIRLHVAENMCISDEVQKDIIVKPVPFAGFDADNEICLYDALVVTYNSSPFDGQQYAWSFDGADLPFGDGPGPYLPRWDTEGIKRLSLSVDLHGCVDTRSTYITVHPVPDVRITNLPGPVCIGDKIFLAATGGVKYQWLPQDSMLYAPDGRMYAQILKPSVYKVIASSEHGCIDSAAIAYRVVEPCCNFAYPNAFTPNGDGRNDRFRIVTYGNHLEYELSIYNKWGQRVYYGLDAKEGWDGTFHRKACDAGTYFYFLNAKCFTGHQESYKGDVMLLK